MYSGVPAVYDGSCNLELTGSWTLAVCLSEMVWLHEVVLGSDVLVSWGCWSVLRRGELSVVDEKDIGNAVLVVRK